MATETELVEEAIKALEPGHAELNLNQLRFQLYLVATGRRPGDTAVDYLRAGPPCLWLHDGWRDGAMFLVWSRARGTKWFLHRDQRVAELLEDW